MKIPLIVIAGPTACGKTDTAINLALKINGEIISADSMQVYKYMDIGTAKVSKKDMKGIPHYLIDALYPDQDFSVSVFKDMAKECIYDITNRNKVPILVGGTGFYINALVYDVNFTKASHEEVTPYRKTLYELAENKGIDFIYEMLKEIDPQATLQIHKNNVKRVVRALEFYKETGQKISEHNKEEKLREEAYNTKFFILNTNREKLYKNIENRIDIMIEKGLIEEVQYILGLGYDENLISMKGIGYKEIITYLKGETTLEETIDILKRNTRRFAKRQVTWFKNKSHGIWVDMDNYKNIDMVADEILEKIKK